MAVGGTKDNDEGATTTDDNDLLLSREERAKKEEEDKKIEFKVITNDGTAEHSIQLITLKNIFATQLPKMPKEYIVRLVLDRKHRSMVIVKNGVKVVGGICYRPYETQGFAEIAFCAITASEQVKGYGTRLMNHTKEHVKTEGISHFLTYADNYAIGYFSKQGFSKSVSMPRERWAGYIKDYDGGTLMECQINSDINYLEIPQMLEAQRNAVLDKIKSNAHVVYPGIQDITNSIIDIPGVKEAGWTLSSIRSSVVSGRSSSSALKSDGKSQLMQILKRVRTHRSAWPFHESVDTTVVTDYLDVVKDPIDLSLISKRLKNGDYYKTKDMLLKDLHLMCDNCILYNAEDTNYYKAAVDLKSYLTEKYKP